ncbi:App1 family protein [Nocardioides sp.]|uniref:App1 family protein n=1 Tax=Nocardioides sp. TaxID=35761 RepID=UPI002C4A1661|nr:phosphatase domain-containing protein [Nocardioides sp.]HXH79582.1 phosphatase domain-containing protein [Nocardioides sp.]
MRAVRWIYAIENTWDARRQRRAARRSPANFRIEAYGAHGTSTAVVVRGRVVDDPPLSEAVDGEGVWTAMRRTLRGFLTDELPGVPLRVEVAGTEVLTTSDSEGYFLVQVAPGPLDGQLTTGTVELVGDYRGVTGPHTVPLTVHVTAPGAAFGIVSDIDDTILETGVQRIARMVVQTFTGSAVTRVAFPGAAELYRDLTHSRTNPVFYISSSPWNLYAFIVGFLRHRGFPSGPVLLRDLLGRAAGEREEKHARIREVLDLHPDLAFVLIGDSGEKDPEIYADIVREYPGRILAVYIREVRLDPGDGRVERISGTWAHETPFVLAADSDAVRAHAEKLGLIPRHS